MKKKQAWSGGKGGKGGKDDEPQLLRAGQFIRPPRGSARSKLRWVRSRKSDAKKQSRFRTTKKQVVSIGDVMTVGDLARELSIEVEDCIDQLANDAYSLPTSLVLPDDAELLVMELGKLVRRVSDGYDEAMPEREEVPEEALEPRPAVIAVMGHVDHGKTSLLDALRNSSLASAEAGGITQKIGAFSVPIEDSPDLTFLDTPGHAAFSAMRARGANATDITVLVVAADDGVKPQTIEAIRLARQAKTPLVVAITKCDKPGANPQAVRDQLMLYEVLSDELGGEDLFVEVSATTGEGLLELQESIVLQAEMMSLEAPVEGVGAEGLILEARPDKGLGVVCTVLVQGGTLRTGDILVAGTAWGKVKRLKNDKGETIDVVRPGAAAEVVGFKDAPGVGVEVLQVETESIAKKAAEGRQQRADALRMHQRMVAAERLSGEGMIPLRLVVKADSHGALQAISAMLSEQVNEEVGAHVVHQGVGAVTQSDIDKASIGEAQIVGFGVPMAGKVGQYAKLKDVPVFRHQVVYHIIDHVHKELGYAMPPEVIHDYQGAADVVQIFSINGKRRSDGKKNAAGCKVVDGTLSTKHKFRVSRTLDGEEEQIHEGMIKEIRHFKEEVASIKSGHECGIMLEGWDEFKPGDKIEAYLERHEPRSFRVAGHEGGDYDQQYTELTQKLGEAKN